MTIQLIQLSKVDELTETDLKIIKTPHKQNNCYIFIKTVVKKDNILCYYRTSHIINYDNEKCIYRNIVSLVSRENYIVTKKINM